MERGESAASRAASHAGGEARPQSHARRDAQTRSTTLVLGGPGTGKTARVIAAAEEARALGQEAIVVAVSASAAATLKARAGGDAKAAPGPPRVLTPPGLALLVLRETAPAGARPPRLIGRSERLAMLHEFVAGRDLAAGAPTPADLLERIDRLASHGIDGERVETWAAALADGPFAARQREFGALVSRHERLLADRGFMAAPSAVLAARRALSGARFPVRLGLLAIDDAQGLAPAELDLILDLARAAGAPLLATADDDQSGRGGDAASAPIRTLLARIPDAAVVHLEQSQRLREGVARAAELVVAPAAGRLARPALGAAEGGSVGLHRHEGGHEQASAVAAQIAASVAGGTRPERVAVVCVDPARDARAMALALEARGVASDAVDLDSDADRPEVRDLLAWVRLLLDPSDAGAVVRALSRPPVALPGPDLARIVRVARRRRVSIVEAVRGALEGPGMEPRSRERAQEFLGHADRFAARIDSDEALVLLRDLIAALGLHRRQLAGAGPDARAAVRAMRRVEAAASGHVARAADATPREVFAGLAALLDAGALPETAEREHPGDAPGAVRIVGVRLDELRALDVDELHLVGLDRAAVEALDHEPLEPLLGEERQEGLGRARRLIYMAMTRSRSRVEISIVGDDPSPLFTELADGLHQEVSQAQTPVAEEQQLLEAAGALRDRLSQDIARAAAGIADLRLDGDVELTHSVVRVLELVKVAALLGRDAGSAPMADAIEAINHQLGAIVSPMQRELLQTSDLDERLIAGDRVVADSAVEPSIAAFLPRRGEGIGLSATDIATYMMCPLQYKFGRVLKVPRPQTVQQRFGIAVHQAVERFHAAGGGPLPKLLGLLDQAWRTGGLGTDEESLQFRARADKALRDYHARLAIGPGEPVWVERPFDFRIGRHALRGRVDRVDRLPDGGYELIDIKTGPPREAADLQRDVQLALYDLAARDAWKLEPTLRSYYYVLDDHKVQLESGVDAAWVTETVEQVGAGIETEQFEPTPSPKACGWC
ncbi:MAG: PD-(D/E)XK nuclease family protein, partial [Solirubrobacteraceae bacterium]|nr:PD-(D/E)XK nuclease family protein [Solirubrobacteraceae bacterium]